MSLVFFLFSSVFQTPLSHFVISFHPDNDQNVALCANELPNFVNLEHCKISYEENVCIKEDATILNSGNTLNDVQMVVTFDYESLSKLHNMTLNSSDVSVDRSRYIYAVDDLEWDDSVDINVTVLPCVAENPVSRWKPRPDLNNSSCISKLENKSTAAFVHALETSNDDNPFLRDVYLWNELDGEGCDEKDAEARGMLVMTSEGCWENVHPDYL